MATFSEKESGHKSPHSIVAGNLRVVFDWRGDRYGHRIERLVDDAWVVILESIEGSPADDWPPSPVLQSLHIEHRPEGAVALLVGKASTSHWSASVEPEASAGRFVLDVACRISDPPTTLGSAYQAIAVEPWPIDVAALSSESVIECRPGAETWQWRIRPADVPPERPRTVRWRYAISILG